MQVLKAGASYSAAVLGAGFVSGTMRTLWIVPLVGVRIAELMEAPLLLGSPLLQPDGSSDTSPWSA